MPTLILAPAGTTIVVPAVPPIDSLMHTAPAAGLGVVAVGASESTQVAAEIKEKGKHMRCCDGRAKLNEGGMTFIDLTDVPSQPLILKNSLPSHANYKDNSRRRPVKPNSSRFTGVSYDKISCKYRAQIMVNKRVCFVGFYGNEEDAAADYARAAFKYKVFKNDETFGGLDLRNVPQQDLILSNSNGSGYKGVKKMRSRYQAQISIPGRGIGGNHVTLGTFDSAEEAAAIYARAAYFLEQRR